MRTFVVACAAVILLSMIAIMPAQVSAQEGPPTVPGVGGGSSARAADEGENQIMSHKDSLHEIPSAGGSSDATAPDGIPVTQDPGAQAGRVVTSTYEDPESGYAGVMREQQWRTMSTNLLSSPLALSHIVWQLTDPGVAQGFSNASQQGMGILHASYLQQLHESQKEAVQGGEGVQRTLERMACMRQERQRLIDAGEEDNWYKASAVCRRALDISKPTDGATDPEEMVTTGETSPNAERLNKEESVRCNELQGRQSFVETWMVPERQMKPKNAPSYSLKVREVFKERFGDVVQGYRRSSNPVAGNDSLIFCVDEPLMPARERMSQLRNALWNDFFSLLETRCKASPKIGANIAKKYIPFDPAQRTSFWKLNASRIGHKFDFASYQFKPATIDIIYEMFIAKELGEVTEDVCKARLSPSEPANDITTLLRGGVRSAGLPVRIRDEHRFVNTLLEFVARGQTLDMAYNWGLYLDKGNKERFYLKTPPDHAIALLRERLAEFAGIPDVSLLQRARQQNYEQFMGFISSIHQLGAEQSGRGGKGLIDAFSSAREGQNNTMGSGLAGQGRF